MYALVENGSVTRLIQSPIQLEINQVNYPPSIFVAPERYQLGIYDVVEKNIQDEKYYIKDSLQYTVDSIDETNGLVHLSFKYTPKSLSQLKQIKKQDINQLKERIQNGGILFDDNGTIYKFSTQERDIKLITGKITSILIGNSLTPGYFWRDIDNNDMPVDDAKMKALGTAISNHFDQAFIVASAHKAAIDNLTVDVDVINYDITAAVDINGTMVSWPKNP